MACIQNVINILNISPRLSQNAFSRCITKVTVDGLINKIFLHRINFSGDFPAELFSHEAGTQ